MKIAIIGFGKLGYHLSKVFVEKGFEVTFIYNRSSFQLPEFITHQKVEIIHDLSKLRGSDVDLCILAISDDHISEVSDILPQKLHENTIIAHTSGIHGPEVLNENIQKKAAFYPLNSFSPDADINWKETPIFITANQQEETELVSLAKKISGKVYAVDSQQKKVIHTTAVFVNNFPNALFRMASHILRDHDMDLEPLHPLIKTTFEKIRSMPPEKSQTGPAIRGDMETIEKHLQLLESYPFEKQIYQLLSHYINPEIQDHYEND